MTSKIPDRYKDLNQKISGGQGDVYVCRDRQLERRVAIKFVKDVSDIDRLLKEVSILQGLRCRHVVEIFDLIRKPGSTEIGLVEEFLGGDDLVPLAETAAEGTEHPSEQLLRLFYQIASGIAELHSSGVVHRDIKLNNIKFDDEGLTRIFDFGLAKDESDPATLGFKGTYGFAAPEMFEDEVKIEKPVDVYAFGICCHLLATGNFPVGACDVPPQALSPRLGLLRPDLPSDVCAEIDRCLRFEADDRPPMTVVRDLLREHLVAGRHVGTLCDATKRYVLKEAGKAVKISAGTHGSAIISYDGRTFRVKETSGDVYVNNIPASPGMVLPGASVLTFGAPDKKAARRFFTFDVSHPEVVL